jgi:hypothetical protein
MSHVDSGFRSGVNEILALLEFYAEQIGSLLRTIQIGHQPDATIFSIYYPDIYLQLNMFQAFSRQSSGAQRLQ